jgi:hypothetical protein
MTGFEILDDETVWMARRQVSSAGHGAGSVDDFGPLLFKPGGKFIERVEIENGCACRKSNPAILVMQSAEDWAAKNTPCPLNSTR